jgi:hypothetical protein
MGKRIRYPKKKVKEEEKKEEQTEQKNHYVLDVHSVTTQSSSVIGK